MTDYPAPVPPCDSVDVRRRTRLRRLLVAGGVGVAVRLLIVGAELAAWAAVDSGTLLVDAVASLADVVASLSLLAAVRYAARPPDDDHPFGHGKFEPLAGLQLGVLIVLLGGWLAARQLASAGTSPAAGVLPPWACVVPLLAAALLEATARAVRRVGRREHSTALLTEAAHYRVDAATSVVAGVGLLLAAATPAFGALVDHLGAAVLAVLMVGLGLRATWENLHQLVDRVPDPAAFDRVSRAAASVPGVRAVEKVRIQHAGPDAHVDIDVEVDPAETVAAAHRIAQHVRAAVQTDWPSVREVVVHVEPFYAGDH